MRRVARPRNEKNPQTSVNVVMITLDAIAGSTRNVFSAMGTRVPTTAATIMLKIRARPRMNASSQPPFHR